MIKIPFYFILIMNYAERKGKQFFEELYLHQGLSVGKIAKLENTTSTTIRSALKHHQIAARQQRKFSDAEIQQVTDLHTHGKTINNISETLGMHYQSVKKILNILTTSTRSPYSKEELESWFITKNMSGPEIAEMLSVHSSSVYNWLKSYGIDASTKTIPFYESVSRSQLLDLYYSQNLSTNDIASNFGVEVQKVLYALQHYNIECRPTGWKNLILTENKYPNIHIIRDADQLRKLKAELSNKEIADNLNISEGLVQVYSSLYDIPSCKGSSWERLIQCWLDGINIDFTTNTRKIIAPYEVDVYIPNYKLAIEINGVYWHSDTRNDRIDREYHKRKTQLAIESGIKLIQCWDTDLNDPIKLNIIKSKILNKCGKNTNKIFARKCAIVSVPINEQKNILNRHHIQGYVACKIVYGLQYDNKIVAIIGLTKTREGEYDLKRFCAVTNVVGGFQKLLNKFKQDYPEFGSIYTYANMMYTTSLVDNVYTKSGFEFSYWTDPNYFYHKGMDTRSRQQCMKHKLSWLPNFNPNISELSNMIANGWHRVYDCGHAKYLLKNPNQQHNME